MSPFPGSRVFRLLGAVFVGGAIGTLLRALLSTAAPWHPGSWPWATFTANIVGAALLGYLTTRLQERLPPAPYQRPLLGTGLCGGLTTFSTMQVELVRMLEGGYLAMAAGYAVTSLALGYAAVHVTTAAVRRVRLAVPR